MIWEAAGHCLSGKKYYFCTYFWPRIYAGAHLAVCRDVWMWRPGPCKRLKGREVRKPEFTAVEDGQPHFFQTYKKTYREY